MKTRTEILDRIEELLSARHGYLVGFQRAEARGDKDCAGLYWRSVCRTADEADTLGWVLSLEPPPSSAFYQHPTE